MKGRSVIPLRTSRYAHDCRNTLAASLIATLITCASFGVRAQQPAAAIDLQRYLELVVQLSDQVRDIDDDLVARQLDVDLTELAFDTRVTPLVNFSVGAAADTPASWGSRRGGRTNTAPKSVLAWKAGNSLPTPSRW